MKRRIQMFLPLAFAALFFVACSDNSTKTETVDTDKLKVEIQALEDAFSAGEKAKNVDSVVAYYSDNATSFSRNEPPSVGKEAIKAKIAKSIAEDTLAGSYNVYKVVDLYAEGNSATEIGSWTRFNAAGTELEQGYYMSYFLKKDGKYQCVRDMSVKTSPDKKP